MANGLGNDPFGNMDDLFSNFFGQMGGNGQENPNARYMVNGRELSPEEVQQLRQSGQLPGQNGNQSQRPQQGQPMQGQAAQQEKKE